MDLKVLAEKVRDELLAEAKKFVFPEEREYASGLRQASFMAYETIVTHQEEPE